jgi:hypothetical protein
MREERLRCFRTRDQQGRDNVGEKAANLKLSNAHGAAVAAWATLPALLSFVRPFVQ